MFALLACLFVVTVRLGRLRHVSAGGHVLTKGLHELKSRLVALNLDHLDVAADESRKY